MKAPADWKSALLHRVAEVRSGLSKSAKREGPTVKRPYLRVANVQDGFLDLSEIKEIDVRASQVARFTLKPGDLLLIEGNGNPENLGRGCTWDGQIPECVHQNHVFSVRTLPDAEILPEFLALQLQSDHGRNYLLSCAKGSTGLSTLNSAQLKEFPLLLPRVTEQRSVVAAIAAWDTAIQKAEQLIAAKERHLGHLRDHLLRKPNRASPIKLHEVTQELIARNGTSLGRDAIMAVTKQVGMRPMREETIAANIERYKVVPPNAFAYNPMRLNIGSIAISPFDRDVLVSPDYVVFACDDSKLLPSYLQHLRHSHKWKSHFELAGNGSVRVRIYYGCGSFVTTRSDWETTG
jgi:type I restriction enzyme, S subunit